MRKAGVAHNKSSKDMESHVFMKAKTRVNLYLLPQVIGCQKKFVTNCRNSKASALKNTEVIAILIYMCCFFYLEVIKLDLVQDSFADAAVFHAYMEQHFSYLNSELHGISFIYNVASFQQGHQKNLGYQ